jgi:uncharacterized membrane protein YkvA (DUF1232 family)
MGFLRLIRFARLRHSFMAAFRLLRSPRVPVRLKLTAAVVALLILSPLNVLGYIPFIGLFDDVALLGLLAGWFVRAAGRHELAA